MNTAASTVRSNAINTTRVRTRSKKKAAVPSNIIDAIAVALVAACLIILMVAFSAYSAKLQTENNQLQENIAHLQADVDSLNEQIVDRTKIENISSIATQKLGMIYPTSENCINIDSSSAEDNNSLAAAIKNEAYN